MILKINMCQFRANTLALKMQQLNLFNNNGVPTLKCSY